MRIWSPGNVSLASALLSLLATAAACDGSPAPSGDAADVGTGAEVSADAALDAPPADTFDAPPADALDAAADVVPKCRPLERAYDELISDDEECNSARDCVMVGTPDRCGCTAALGPHAVHREIADAAAGLQRKYENCPDPKRLCDYAPAKRVYCDNGDCRFEHQSCLPPPRDVGQPDTRPLPDAHADTAADAALRK